MKFFKPVFITFLLFSAIVGTLIYSSCEKDACNNVVCYNGGSCGHGLCNCPTGFEGYQCQQKVIDRYVGTYYGYSLCNAGAQFFDTVVITADHVANNTLGIRVKSYFPKVLHGYVQNNESTYSVIITNNDTAVTDSSFSYKTYTVTLQVDKQLSIHSYTHYKNPSDTFFSSCSFLGSKK